MRCLYRHVKHHAHQLATSVNTAVLIIHSQATHVSCLLETHNKANHKRQQAGWTLWRSPVLAGLEFIGISGVMHVNVVEL